MGGGGVGGGASGDLAKRVLDEARFRDAGTSGEVNKDHVTTRTESLKYNELRKRKYLGLAPQM